jgi:adenylate cyclase
VSGTTSPELTVEALQARVRELELEVELSQACVELNDEADELLEQAMRERLSLTRTLKMLLPLLCRHSGARVAFVHTLDEDLRPRDFACTVDADCQAEEAQAGVVSERFGAATAPIVAAAERREEYLELLDGGTVLGRELDVAGELFGCAALRYDDELDGPALARARRLLGVWCEEVDNYLAAIARARHKHRITRAISDALKHPILDRGIDQAIEELRRHVDFDDLILVYRHEEDLVGGSLNYKVIKDRVLRHDSRGLGQARVDRDVDRFMRQHALSLILGQDDAVCAHFGLTRYREEVLINGVKHEQLVGRLMVASQRGEFNTFDRDLLERFADYLRQRIVDFNKEYKRLALCFPQPTVEQLLSAENYTERHLLPRERDVAVMFCDISGFTRVSEQVLREPALIGKLIDRWSERAVEIIWQTGGVFDKMVGDCVIGLWGPPIFDGDAAACCHGALAAAEQIRDFTVTLGKADGLPQLEGLDPPLGVATGLNYCPLFVGLFGPNEDYTGFSAGMNNTARLQGLATRDEILCMDAFVTSLGDDANGRFGDERSATVKNVAEPLRFHALR